jgi:hypothetical protein
MVLGRPDPIFEGYVYIGCHFPMVHHVLLAILQFDPTSAVVKHCQIHIRRSQIPIVCIHCWCTSPHVGSI